MCTECHAATLPCYSCGPGWAWTTKCSQNKDTQGQRSHHVEGVEGHLGGGLSHRLRRYHAHGLPRLHHAPLVLDVHQALEVCSNETAVGAEHLGVCSSAWGQNKTAVGAALQGGGVCGVGGVGVWGAGANAHRVGIALADGGWAQAGSSGSPHSQCTACPRLHCRVCTHGCIQGVFHVHLGCIQGAHPWGPCNRRCWAAPPWPTCAASCPAGRKKDNRGRRERKAGQGPPLQTCRR